MAKTQAGGMGGGELGDEGGYDDDDDDDDDDGDDDEGKEASDMPPLEKADDAAVADAPAKPTPSADDFEAVD